MDFYPLSPDEIDYIETLAAELAPYRYFQRLVARLPTSRVTSFSHPFAAKLALQLFLPSLFAVESIEVAATAVLTKALEQACRNLPEDCGVNSMTEGYPLALVATICGVTREHVHIVGSAIRLLVELCPDGAAVPERLMAVGYNTIPLFGASNSPLSKTEFEAICAYLGSRRTLWVRILLQAVVDFEMYEYDSSLSLPEILQLCRQSWVVVLLTILSGDIEPSNAGELDQRTLSFYSSNPTSMDNLASMSVDTVESTAKIGDDAIALNSVEG